MSSVNTQQNQQPIIQKTDEHILVVERSHLFPTGNWHGLQQVDFDHYLHIINHKQDVAISQQFQNPSTKTNLFGCCCLSVLSRLWCFYKFFPVDMKNNTGNTIESCNYKKAIPGFPQPVTNKQGKPNAEYDGKQPRK